MKHIRTTIAIFILCLLVISTVGCTGTTEPDTQEPVQHTPPETETEETHIETPETVAEVIAEKLPETTEEVIPEPTDGETTEPLPTTCPHELLLDGYAADNAWHSIDSTLIDYVGFEAFDAWQTEKSAKKDENAVCPYAHITIAAFVKDFSISRETMEVLQNYALYLHYDYNLDAIYGTPEEAEAYYTSDRTQNVLRCSMLRKFKHRLRNYAEEADLAATDAWFAAKSEEKIFYTNENGRETELPYGGALTRYSIVQYIEGLEIPKEAAIQIYEEVRAEWDDCHWYLDLVSLYEDIAAGTVADGTPMEVDFRYMLAECTGVDKVES